MKKEKHYFRSMSSVYRALRKHLPDVGDVPVFREVIDGKTFFAVWY